MIGELDLDVLNVIAKNASPLTQLYMKHVVKTRLTPQAQQYEKLFRDKNYEDLFILATNDGDIDTIRKVLSLYRKPMLKNVDSDTHTLNEFMSLRRFDNHDVTGKFNAAYYEWETDRTRYTDFQPQNLPFALNNEAAAIAVANNRLDILQLLDSTSPPNNHLTLMEIAAFLGHNSIIDYIREKYPHFPTALAILFAIKGKQLETFKKYLSFLPRNAELDTEIYVKIFSDGIPEMFRHMRSTGRSVVVALERIHHVFGNKDMFTYLYKHGIPNYDGTGRRYSLYDYATISSINRQDIQFALIACGMLKKLRIFRQTMRPNVRLEEINIAIERNHLQMLKYLLSIQPIRSEHLHLVNVGFEMFKNLQELQLIDFDLEEELNRRTHERRIFPAECKDGIKIFDYSELKIDPSYIIGCGRVECLQYFHKHHPEVPPDVMWNSFLDRMDHHSLPLKYFLEFERLYGKLHRRTGVRKRVELDHCIDIVIHLEKIGRINLYYAHLSWLFRIQRDFFPNNNVEDYIDQLHYMNQFTRLIESIKNH
jgi:hypothetical protein